MGKEPRKETSHKLRYSDLEKLKSDLFKGFT
jgi:hypothetical protein